MERKTPHLLAVSSLALAGCLWGNGFLFGKIAMTEMTVTENVSYRFLTGRSCCCRRCFGDGSHVEGTIWR